MFVNTKLTIARVKALSFRQYKVSTVHKEQVKGFSIGKYRDNILHKSRAKEMSKTKYRLNKIHRHNVKAASIRKYHQNPDRKKRVVADVTLKRQRKRVNTQQFDFVMKQFLDKVADGPEFVCCVCHRLLFRQQVLHCKTDAYNKTGTVASIAANCISENYLHHCNDFCDVPSVVRHSSREAVDMLKLSL